MTVWTGIKNGINGYDPKVLLKKEKFRICSFAIRMRKVDHNEFDIKKKVHRDIFLQKKNTNEMH